MPPLDLKDIARSWFRVGFHTDEQKALAEERLAMCEPCEFRELDMLRVFHKCVACGCPLQSKVYSSRGAGACPKGKWLQ